MEASAHGAEQCESALARAVEELSAARQTWGEIPLDPAEAAVVRQLRVQIMVARRLLQNALDYRQKWQQLLAAMTGGYTATGGPAPLCPQGRISLAG